MDNIKRYLTFVKPYKGKIFWTVLVGIVKFGIPLLMPLILKYVVDDIIGAENMSDSAKISELLWIMGGAFGIFLILRPPVEYKIGRAHV